MNSSRDKVAMDAMYVVLGGSGNTGAIIADFLRYVFAPAYQGQATTA